MFKTILLVTGGLAAVAWTKPGLVTLGLYLGVIPGLILAAAPTVFVYLLMIAGFRWLLPLPAGPLGWVIAIGLALLVGWGVNQPKRWVETRRYQSALRPEIVPEQPVQLSGEVALILPKAVAARGRALECSHVCAALLDTPGVTGVTVSDGTSRRRFTLVPRGTRPDLGLRPKDPERIVQLFEKADAMMRRRNGGDPIFRSYADRDAMREAAAASWMLRLNTRETLVSAAVQERDRADWTIEITEHREFGTPAVRRVEVRREDGTPVMRRSGVTHAIPSPLFAWDFAGMVSGSHFKPAQTLLSSGGRYAYDNLDPEAELLAHVAVARPDMSLDAAEVLRSAVEAALGDPVAEQADLTVTRDWLARRTGKPSEGDESLLLRIAEDLRVRDIAGLLQTALPKAPPPAFRHGFARRILDPATSEADVRIYATMLARMPVGTFAKPTAEERAIWAAPHLRNTASPFLERMADQGAAALPTMVALLREAAAESSRTVRSDQIREIRRGFARMGKEAAPAIPAVLELFDRRSSPLMNVIQERSEWEKTLVLMGLPLDDMPYPKTFGPEQIEGRRADILRAVERYDPDSVRDGYNY